MFVGKLTEDDIKNFIDSSILKCIKEFGEEPIIKYEDNVVKICVACINQEIVLSDFYPFIFYFTHFLICKSFLY